MRLTKFATKLAKRSGEDIAVGIAAEVVIALVSGWIIGKITKAKEAKHKTAEIYVGDEVVATAEVEDK